MMADKKTVILIFCFFIIFQKILTQDIVPRDRRIDWQPGVPGGIPDYPVGVNVMNYGATGSGIANDTRAFLEAITACPDSHAVFIPAGHYLITDRLNIGKPIVLRGAGPDQTFLKFEKLPDAGEYQRTNIWIGVSTVGFSANILAGCNKGSNRLMVNDVSDFTIGDLVEIRQDNDPAVMARPIVPPEENDSWAEDHWGWRAVGQFLLITAMDEMNNSLTFHKPLYYTYNLKMNPKITKCINPTRYAGVEDLHLELVVDCNAYYGNIQMDHAVYCWVKNVRSYKCSRSHIGIWGGLGNVIRDSYFEYGHGYAGGQAYGVNLVDRATDNLIENNIFDYLQGKMMTAIGVCGNVYGYNYGRRSMDDRGDWAEMHADMSAHGHHAYMNLFEGNSTNKASVDRYWGSNANYIFLRNIMLCPDGYENQYTCTPALIEKNNPYMSFIGNILHHENSMVNHIVWRTTDEPDDFSDPNLTLATLIRHGNYDYLSENSFWDPDISDRLIPSSYYLKEKPEFFTNAPWGDLPWPVTGPDLLHEGIIPAQQRFCDLNGITPPQAPGNLTATADHNRVNLSWVDQSNNEAGFRIEQSRDGQPFQRAAVTMADSTTYTFSGLESYTTYYFRVCSYIDEAGNSVYSNIASATTGEACPLELIAWYKFDGNAADSSGNNYHGEADGPVLTEGRSGQAYLFDGVDDIITVPSWDAPLDSNNQAFTLTAWIYPRRVSVKNWIISDDSPWGNFNFGLDKDRLLIKWLKENNTRYFLKSVEYPVIKANTFSHVAISYDPINRIVRLYLNGQQIAIDRCSKPGNPWLFNRLYIGRGADQGEMESFNGIIDDLRIYKSYLSGNDIAKIYYGGMIPPEAPINLTAEALSSTEVYLSWQYYSTVEDGFRILRSRDSTNFTPIAQVHIMPTNFYDSGLLRSIKYYYMVKAFHALYESEPAIVSVKTLEKPIRLYLSFNYPNPFKSSTNWKYELMEDGRTVITIYDIRGRKVRTLLDGWQQADWYYISWDGKDNHAERVSSGIYIICLKCKSSRIYRKVLLVN
jgi:hypothetical protein